jgi:chromosome segregation ATPase
MYDIKRCWSEESELAEEINRQLESEREKIKHKKEKLKALKAEAETILQNGRQLKKKLKSTEQENFELQRQITEEKEKAQKAAEIQEQRIAEQLSYDETSPSFST